MDKPKKYVKINGVMKLNPEYKKWREQNEGGGGGMSGKPPVTTVANPDVALPVICNMDDHEQLNDNLNVDIPLSESTNATIEMMQEPEIALNVGLDTDTMVDELGKILGKYEVPMGLMNKLMMISEFQSLEFIIDDSGSMNCPSDTINPVTGKPNTRWEEAHLRLKEMIELLAYVPFQQIGIEFLNRKNRISLSRETTGKDPESFLKGAYNQIDQIFKQPPSGTTPALEKLTESFQRGQQGVSIARYFFGDGVPNGGLQAQQQITKMIINRANPESNPVTFISCTNEDDQVEWMKTTEEVAPYCSESDDFKDECAEVLGDQGPALPYTKGFHLVCQLIAAINPNDLDAMDESIPFTKQTLDNLLGIQHNIESYQHYFTNFVQQQQKRPIKDQTDQLKRSIQWNYEEFLKASTANQISQVQQFKQQLKQVQGH